MMRKAAVVLLFLIIIGLLFLFFIRNIFDQVADDNVLLFIGEVHDKQAVGEFDYPGGVMEEYLAYDEEGNRVGIYYDQDTKKVQGFWISMPPATEITINQKQAEDIATDLASEISFFEDPNIALLKSKLIDRGSGTDKYYYFYWATVDDTSGATLLRHIEIRVNAETGEVFYLKKANEGTVNIKTEPLITAVEAENKVIGIASELFINPRVEEPLLYVSTAHNGQLLVWIIYVVETGDPDNIALYLRIIIDASTGEIIDKYY